MNDPLIGVGVLGTGVMGQRMMVAMQQHATRLRVAAMYDPDGASLRAAVALAPQARAAADPEDLVGDPAVRLVYIATPPALHLAGVSASLAAGRACLCEKPLSSDVADALAMHRAVHSAGLPFAVNFPFASSTSARRLVGIVRSGELGLLQAATIRLRFSRWPRAWQAAASSWLSGAAEGGFTREVLSHFVFLAQRCFGPATVSDVRLQREPGDAETALVARLQHADVVVQIDAAVAGDIADDNRFEIIGSQGRVVLSGWSRLDHGGEITEVADGIGNMLRTLPGLLAGRADHGLATVDEALGVVQCVEALLRG
jgi:predicted dehydrogenase